MRLGWQQPAVAGDEWRAYRGPQAATVGRAARRAGPVVLSVLATAGIAWLVRTYDAGWVLTALLLLAGVVFLLVRPQVATLLTVFLLYINVPAILTQQHGVPEIAAGAFVGLLGLPLLQSVIVGRARIRADAVLALMAALLAVDLLSTLGAIDKGIAAARVLGFVSEGLVLYWLIVNAIPDMQTFRKVVWSLLAAASLVSLLCVYQDATGDYDQEFGGLAYRNYDPLLDAAVDVPSAKHGQWHRAQGPVNEPNRFAQILIVLLPLGAWLHRTASSRWGRVLAALGSACTIVGVLLTMSRGAMLVLLLLAGAMLSLKWIQASRAVGLVVALLAAASAFAPFLLDRIDSLATATSVFSKSPGGYEEADGAVRGRMTEMLAALHVFLDHPVLGVGPGQFAPFYVEAYSRNPDIKFRQITTARRAHTLYLELAAETGLVGLAVFLAIVGLVLRGLRRARSAWKGRDAVKADLAAACALSLLAYLGTGVFLHLSYQRYYWLIVALGSSAVFLMRVGRGAPRTSPALVPQSETEAAWQPSR